jgi:ParB/RepB/Spo0J family partition protein
VSNEHIAQADADVGRVLNVPLDELRDSPFQVKRYDDARVRDLAESIRQQGLLQPATIRLVDGCYELISGHARRAAFRYLRDRVATNDDERANYSAVRCVLLTDIDDARAAALTAIENLQRDDGTPLEQALMVARARDAGKYRSIPETAEALGLPLGRVRQYLQLADAPVVLQRAVSPGVMVTRDGGTRERVTLPVTSVLAVRPYYDFLSASRLAELKSAALARRRRDERRGQVDETPDSLRRQNEHLEASAAEFAAERTERLLSMAARHLWPVSKLQAKVRSTRRPERPPLDTDAPVESEPVDEPLASSVPPSPAARLYSERRGRLTIWPSAIPTADVDERSSLAGRLRTVLEALEG